MECELPTYVKNEILTHLVTISEAKVTQFEYKGN